MTIDENGRKVDYIVLCNRNFAKRKSDELCPSFSKEPVLCQIDILYAPFLCTMILLLLKKLCSDFKFPGEDCSEDCLTATIMPKGLMTTFFYFFFLTGNRN